MEPIVVDTNVLVASSIESEAHHEDARAYINGLGNGDWVFHLPMLVVVEVISAIGRRASRNWLALASVWKQNVVDWERDGQVVLYPLDRICMSVALGLAEQQGLRGADSVIAALAEELDMLMRTFDEEIVARVQRASL